MVHHRSQSHHHSFEMYDRRCLAATVGHQCKREANGYGPRTAKEVITQCPPRNLIVILIVGLRLHALVDTGAATSIINQAICKKLCKMTTPYDRPVLRSAATTMLSPASIKGPRYPVQSVVPPCYPHDVILCWDFLGDHAALIDYSAKEFFLVCHVMTINTSVFCPTKYMAYVTYASPLT